MRRSAILLVLALACGGDDEPDCPGVGCFADTGTSSAGTSASSTTASSTTASSTTASTTNASSTSADESSSGDASASTTMTTSSTSAGSSSESSTGMPCDTDNCPALAECFGLGVWESCTQYCTALDQSCIESGCDGATVVYYGDANACIDMSGGNPSSQACDAGFMQGGAQSFGRCCCQ